VFTHTDLPVPTINRQAITRLHPIQLSNDQHYWPAPRTRIDAERWQGRRNAPNGREPRCPHPDPVGSLRREWPEDFADEQHETLDDPALPRNSP
jgi:hypothetical protein